MSCVTGLSYVSVENKPYIVLITRDSNGKRNKRFIQFYPYFFVREFDYDNFRANIDKDLLMHIIKSEGGFTGVDGFKVRKITVDDPHCVSSISREATLNNIPLYESNIPYAYRFLIDNNLVSGIDLKTLTPVDLESKHKIAFIDIEVYKDSAPDIKKDKITIIGIFDYLEKKYYSIFIGSPDTKLDLSVIKTEYKDIEIHACANEEELLETFATVWLKIEPDIIVSFSTFDMEYIIGRLEVNGINPRFLSPVYQVNNGKGKQLKIQCVNIVDFAEVYRKVMGEPVWSTLDYISNEELGYGKLEVDSFVKMFDENPTKLVEYNLRDVELLNDLENKIGVLSNYLMVIWKYTGLDLADCLMANSIGDILHLRHIHGKYIFYSKSPNPYIKYDGALVGGVIGLHNNVCVLDWNELYPTIMEMFHISIDTFEGTLGPLKLIDEKNEMLNASFAVDRPGWTVEIMKPFRQYRQIIKKKAKTATNEEDKRKYKLISQAVKVISNSQYGLYGQKTDRFTSRFYDARIANAICLVGRILNREARGIVEALGYEWVYYDTDSLFVKLKGVDGEVDFLKNTIEEKLRVFLKETYGVTSLMRLDFEYTFSAMLVLAKKKYIGLPTDGSKPVVKGLRIIQKNTAIITAIEEEKVGRMRMTGVPVKELKLYIYTKEHRVASGIEPLENIIVKGKLSKKEYPRATAASKAVAYAKQKLGIDIPVGQRFYWVYIIPQDGETIEAMYDGVMKTYPAKIIAFNSLNQIKNREDIKIDYKAMAKYTIRKPLAHYIEEAEKDTQTSLSSFFSS